MAILVRSRQNVVQMEWR